MTFSKKPVRRANYQVLFFPGNAKFRQGRQVVPYGARSNFHNAGALGFELFFAAGKTPFITQPAPRRPVHCPKHQM